MSITTVLLDLDGTLLPMDQDVFTKHYFGLLAKKLAPYGYDPKLLVDAIWAGTAAMVKNQSGQPNEKAFWNAFTAIFGEQALEHLPVFEEFYHNEFQEVKASCGFTPLAAAVIAKVKGKGGRVALATNPLFPSIATESRIRWAGLSPDDFELYTTYENSVCCKPNPDYYHCIVNELGVAPEECLMVGNDVKEDMIAKTIGMKVFLLTDCLINKEEKDISAYPHGDFNDLLAFLDGNVQACEEADC